MWKANNKNSPISPHMGRYQPANIGGLWLGLPHLLPPGPTLGTLRTTKSLGSTVTKKVNLEYHPFMANIRNSYSSKNVSATQPRFHWLYHIYFKGIFMCYAIHLPRNDTRKKHVSEFIEPHSVYVCIYLYMYIYIYIYICIYDWVKIPQSHW